MPPKAKVRQPKICPTCEQEFDSRWSRVVCCSKSCARVLQAKVNGPSNWKGGINKHAAGYLKELSKGHPHGDRNGYVMQHRLIMERHLGRILDPKERVHHKNGTRDDNRIENLELWNVDHKDPAGIRTIDQIRHLLAKLSAEDLQTLRNEI